MLARGATYNLPLHSPTEPSSGGGSGGKENLINALVRRYLLLAQVPASEWSRNEAALCMLGESLLSSSLAPASHIAHEEGVIDAIKKRILRNSPSNGEGQSRLTKFEQVLGSLQRSFPSRKMWAMLCMLLRVAEKNGQGSTSGRMAEILSSSTTTTAATNVAKAVAPATLFTPATTPSASAMSDKPQAEYWRQFLELKQKSSPITEKALLRELVFVLQGIDGNFLRRREDQRSFSVIPEMIPNVNPSIRELVEKIAECGSLFLTIRHLLLQTATANAGSIRQAFNGAVEQQLREYLKIVACFEASCANDARGSAGGGGGGESMTLKRALVWFQDSRYRLTFLLSLVRETMQMNGSELISSIYHYLKHGDNKLHGIVQGLLEEMLCPFQSMLKEFILRGAIADPHHEFFVSVANNNNNNFSMMEDKVPSMLTMDMAKKAFIAGKTRSFITNSENLLSRSMTMMDVDEAFDDAHSIDMEDDKNTTDLALLIKREYTMVCQQVSDLLIKKCHLMDHFCNLRDYFHFCRGDYASALMDGLSGALSKPAASIFRHALVGSLDHALLSIRRNTLPGGANPRERLDVKILETNSSKATGWDVFALDYRVDAPVNAILTESAMAEHLRISHFLWNIRRFAYCTSSAWLRLSKQDRPSRELAADYRRLRLFIQEISCFTRALVEFCQLTVLKCWQAFIQRFEAGEGSVKGLDFFIEAHQGLLHSIRSELFLLSNAHIKAKLAPVLSTIGKIDSVIRGLERYSNLSQEYARRNSRTSLGRESGSNHFGSRSRSLEEEQLLESFSSAQGKLLTEYRSSFQQLCRQFQGDLDEFMLQLQKDQLTVSVTAGGTSTTSPLLRLQVAIDYNGYHQRRNGFDQRKYAGIPMSSGYGHSMLSFSNSSGGNSNK